RDELAGYEEDQARLIAQRRQAEEQERAERAAQIEREVTRRQGELDAENSALLAERALLEDKWGETLARLDGKTPRPEATMVERGGAGGGSWQGAVETAGKRQALAREWAEHLRQEPQTLAHGAQAGANLLACPLSAVLGDGLPAETTAAFPDGF